MRPHRLGQSLSTGASKAPGTPWARRGLAVPALPRHRPLPPNLGLPSGGSTVPDGQRGRGQLPASGSALGRAASTRTPPARAEPRRRALALTRCSAPLGGRGRRSRPSWGPSCWALRAPPVAVSAAPRTLGPWRGAPAAESGRRWGRRRNAEGSARRTDRGTPVQPTLETWRRAGRGGAGARPAGARGGARTESGVRPRGGGGCPNMADPRPRRRPIGGAGGPGAGAVAPAANEGEAGPPPGPIPGGPRSCGPMAGRGADYLSGGVRPHLRPMGARVARLCPATRAPCPPGTSALGCSGLLGLRFPGALPL